MPNTLEMVRNSPVSGCSIISAGRTESRQAEHDHDDDREPMEYLDDRRRDEAFPLKEVAQIEHMFSSSQLPAFRSAARGRHCTVSPAGQSIGPFQRLMTFSKWQLHRPSSNVRPSACSLPACGMPRSPRPDSPRARSSNRVRDRRAGSARLAYQCQCIHGDRSVGPIHAADSAVVTMPDNHPRSRCRNHARRTQPIGAWRINNAEESRSNL